MISIPDDLKIAGTDSLVHLLNDHLTWELLLIEEANASLSIDLTFSYGKADFGHVFRGCFLVGISDDNYSITTQCDTINEVFMAIKIATAKLSFNRSKENGN